MLSRELKDKKPVRMGGKATSFYIRPMPVKMHKQLQIQKAMQGKPINDLILGYIIRGLAEDNREVE